MLLVAGPDHVTSPALDRVRQEVARRLDLLSPATLRFLWVVDFPLFERVPDSGALVSLHHPFTAPHEEDIALLDSEPERVRALAYDCVLNGTELGGGSIRIGDPRLQERVFELLGLDPETARRRFGFLLEGLQSGAPPHGGIAFGVDRITMLLAGAQSLRDVIAFPKTTAAQARAWTRLRRAKAVGDEGGQLEGAGVDIGVVVLELREAIPLRELPKEAGRPGLACLDEHRYSVSGGGNGDEKRERGQARALDVPVASPEGDIVDRDDSLGHARRWQHEVRAVYEVNFTHEPLGYWMPNCPPCKLDEARGNARVDKVRIHVAGAKRNDEGPQLNIELLERVRELCDVAANARRMHHRYSHVKRDPHASP
jgi:hypothetical protein